MIAGEVYRSFPFVITAFLAVRLFELSEDLGIALTSSQRTPHLVLLGLPIVLLKGSHGNILSS